MPIAIYPPLHSVQYGEPALIAGCPHKEVPNVVQALKEADVDYFAHPPAGMDFASDWIIVVASEDADKAKLALRDFMRDVNIAPLN